MESASQHSPKRLLRLAIAGGILATAWMAVDAITHSEPAAAAETIDLIPLGDGSTAGVVNGILTPVTTAISPVVTTVTTPVTQVVTPVVTTVVTPVVTAVVAPVTTPVLTIVDGVATPILTPVVTIVDGVATPVLTSVVEVVTPLIPALDAVLEPVTVLDTAIGLVQAVPAVTPNGTILAVGGTVILGVVLTALATPLLPAPSNGGPLGVPLAPAAPSGSNGSSFVAFYGELNSGVPAGTGAFGTVGASVDDLPSSPTFASDTTPD